MTTERIDEHIECGHVSKPVKPTVVETVPVCPCCGETNYADPRDCSFCLDQNHNHPCRVCGSPGGEPHGKSQDPETLQWSVTCDTGQTGPTKGHPT